VSKIRIFVFWLFFAVALGAGVYAYLALKQNKKPNKSALSVIPDDCMVYFYCPDFSALNRKINSQSLVAEQLKTFPAFGILCGSLYKIDSIFSSEPLLKEETGNSPVHFGLLPSGQWIAGLAIKELGQQSAVMETLQRLPGSGGKKFLTLRLSNKNISVTIEEGVLIFSDSRDLIINAIEKKNSGIEQKKEFKDFKAGFSETSLLSLYIDHRSYATSPQNKKIALEMGARGGFSSGVLELEPSGMRTFGQFKPDSTGPLYRMMGQIPHETQSLLGLLPSNTSAFTAYALPENVLVTEKNIANEFWKRSADDALYNVEREFFANASDYLISFDIPSASGNICVYMKDSVKALEHLDHMSDSIIATEGATIYRLRSQNEVFFPEYFSSAADYALLYQAQLYLSKSPEVLKLLNNVLRRGATLAKNESFVQYLSDHLPQNFNYLVYANPSVVGYDHQGFFNLTKNSETEPFENFRHFSYALTSGKAVFNYRLHLLHETKEKPKDLLWTLSLDTVCRNTASPFINHNTGENEMVIQDDANTLYLINAKGKILWKKKIGGKIRSEIHVVDMFRNGKLQMLFNTEDAIHVLDRNGKEVENFPIRLSSPASAPLSVFDYDRDRTYRIFIPCKNKMIYNYGMDGKKQEGFITLKTENPVKLPLQYISVGESQYLVTLDEQGKIYGFSRRGQLRFTLRNRTVADCKSFVVDAAKSLHDSRLFYFDEKNALVGKIALSDKKDIAKLSSDAENGTAIFLPIDENRSTDALITAGRRIIASDLNGNLIFEKETEDDLIASMLLNDESHSLLLAFSDQGSSLTIFDLLAQTEKKVNASASPMISELFRNNKKYLIVTENDRLNCLPLD
jgi:hypothetical protein